MIPRSFHYYWTGQEFQYVHYLAVLSLLKSTPAARVEVHCEEAPEDNAHWDRLKQLDPVHVEPVDFDRLIEVAGLAPGDFRPFLRLAKVVHRSDFVRYLVLATRGGVYLDFDTLVARDLSPLLNHSILVGYQSPDVLGNDVNGAVLGAAPAHDVLRLCLQRVRAVPGSLRRFRPDNLRPGLLRKFFLPYLHWCDTGPSLLTALSHELHGLRASICPRTYFHFCDYRRWRTIFESTPLPDDAYVIHYFGKMSFEFTRSIDEAYVRNEDSLYACVAKRCLLERG